MVMPPNPTRSNSRPVASSSWRRRSAAGRYWRLRGAARTGAACDMDRLYTSAVRVINTVIPDPAVAGAFFASPDEGPFVMVNLLKFKEHAEYADGSDSHLSGREAYERYGVEVRRLLEALGGRVVFSGAVTGLLLGEVEELWDAVALAEYPSPAAF